MEKLLRKIGKFFLGLADWIRNARLEINARLFEWVIGRVGENAD